MQTQRFAAADIAPTLRNPLVWVRAWSGRVAFNLQMKLIRINTIGSILTPGEFA
jgi:hypothetical protein